jgi:hypothetical protein
MRISTFIPDDNPGILKAMNDKTVGLIHHDPPFFSSRNAESTETKRNI